MASIPENCFPKDYGRVEDWRGIPKVEPSRFSPFPLGVPHYPNRKPVSSPRHIAPSVQISPTGRTCLLRSKGYAAYCAGAAFALVQRINGNAVREVAKSRAR